MYIYIHTRIHIHALIYNINTQTHKQKGQKRQIGSTLRRKISFPRIEISLQRGHYANGDHGSYILEEKHSIFLVDGKGDARSEGNVGRGETMNEVAVAYTRDEGASFAHTSVKVR